jgi:exodeoxyribonuclease VII small subunit
MSPKPKEKFNFGEAFSELEKITNWFEKEEIDLEEGLTKFERGLELAAKLKSRLKEVENRVQEIKAKFGDLVEENRLGDEESL